MTRILLPAVAALQELRGVAEIALGCTKENTTYYERFGVRRVTHACMQRSGPPGPAALESGDAVPQH